MRECGECTMCCLVLEISPLNKARNEPCKFCDKGCTIYNDRPQHCKDFECLWLKDESISEDLRPDICGVVFEKLGDHDIYLALVDPKRPHAWLDIRDFMNKLADEGNAVVVATGKRPVRLPKGKTIDDVRKEIKEYVSTIIYN